MCREPGRVRRRSRLPRVNPLECRRSGRRKICRLERVNGGAPACGAGSRQGHLRMRPERHIESALGGRSPLLGRAAWAALRDADHIRPNPKPRVTGIVRTLPVRRLGIMSDDAGQGVSPSSRPGGPPACPRAAIRGGPRGARELGWETARWRAGNECRR